MASGLDRRRSRSGRRLGLWGGFPGDGVATDDLSAVEVAGFTELPPELSARHGGVLEVWLPVET